MIYLESPIVIEGVTINHTEYGLKYMKEFYEQVLARSSKEKLGDNERKHIETVLIPRYELHLRLYLKLKDNGPTTNNH